MINVVFRFPVRLGLLRESEGRDGKGVCGIFPKEIAEMKSHEINEMAKAHEHPLISEIEPLTD